MNVNKGTPTLNYIFGTFILLSTIKVCSDLYVKYKSSQQVKSCGCKK